MAASRAIAAAERTSHSLTFLPAVQHVRERFGLTQVVMVGDRGMV